MKGDTADYQEKKKSISSVCEEKKGDIFEDLEIQCIEKQKGQFYCTQCQKHPVICGNKQCNCYKNHCQCQYFQRIQNFHNYLNNQLQENVGARRMTKLIDRMFDQLSNMQKLIEKQFRFFGLSQAQQKIAKLILNSQKGQKLKGSYFDQFKNERVKNQDWFKISFSKYKQILDKSFQKMSSLYFQLETKIYSEHLQYAVQTQIKQIDSKILKTQDQLKNLSSFFFQNQEAYRLVQFKFDNINRKTNSKRLVEICNQRKDLLFLVENFSGKKFGAYSNCLLDKNADDWKSDQKGKSFIFCIGDFFRYNTNVNSQGYLFMMKAEKQKIIFKKQKPQTQYLVPKSEILMEINLQGSYRINLKDGYFQDLKSSSYKHESKIKRIEVYQVLTNQYYKQPIQEPTEQKNQLLICANKQL